MQNSSNLHTIFTNTNSQKIHETGYLGAAAKPQPPPYKRRGFL